MEEKKKYESITVLTTTEEILCTKCEVGHMDLDWEEGGKKAKLVCDNPGCDNSFEVSLGQPTGRVSSKK